MRDSHLHKQLLGLNQPRSGVAVVALPSLRDYYRWTAVSRLFLSALGKSHHVSIWKRGTLEMDLRSWLAAYRITDVVLLEAQRTRPIVQGPLIEFFATVDVKLWLVEYEPTDGTWRDTLQPWPVDEHDLGALTALLSRRPAPRAPKTPTPSSPPPFPTVPRSPGAMFLSDCANMLTPEEFAVVDDVHRSWFDRAMDVFNGPQSLLFNEQLATLFRAGFLSLAEPDGVVTVARAIEAASHIYGWHVAVDEPRMRHRAEHTPRAAHRTAEEWARLNLYVRTDIPAVAALIGSDVPTETVARIRLGDIDPTFEHVTDPVTKIVYPITGPARPYLAAHVLRRSFDPDDDGDDLIPPRKSLSGVGKSSRLAETAAQEVGFITAQRTVDLPSSAALRWARQHGFAPSKLSLEVRRGHSTRKGAS